MDRDSGTLAQGKRVGVVGGGTMGVGIVYVFAMAGFAVHLVEPDTVRAQAVMQTLNAAAAGAIQRGKMDAELAQLLVYLDALKRRQFLDAWRSSVEPAGR